MHQIVDRTHSLGQFTETSAVELNRERQISLTNGAAQRIPRRTGEASGSIELTGREARRILGKRGAR
jgi:hypothetical protein